MSSFAVDGLVSGLQTSTLVSQLMQIEAIPQQQLRVRVNENGAYVKALQSVSSALKKLDDAASALTVGAAKWDATTSTVTGEAATATARNGALPGATTVTVDRLATAWTWTSAQATGLDDVVVPSESLQVVDASGTARTLQPASGTLRDVMGAINNAEGLGLRAVAVRVGDNSYRLQVLATDTGAAAPQRFDGSSVTGGGTSADGVDALYSVNGISGTSSTNTVTGLVSGVDVTLQAVGTSTVRVSADPAATVDAVKALVTAANDAIAEARKQTAANPGGTRGPLASDSFVRGLTGRIQGAFSAALGDVNAAAIGIQTTRDGSLVLDEAKLRDTLAADPALVRRLVAPEDASVGIGSRLRDVVTSATGTDGLLTAAIQGRERSTKDLQAQIESWDRRLELRRETLQRQFSALEVSLGRLQSQSTWLSGQIAGLNASLGSSS
ncbi:flagellar filament capping protein FliD [Aquipuribacter sp. SD81]|uniref:flagellar filament capping protein FliD n=1 Tax=Aquipuribacter sp. SD81 TaxID=3127703 RepID=UPI0030190E81